MLSFVANKAPRVHSLLLICTLLPWAAQAMATNPFLTPEANKRAVPPPNVFSRVFKSKIKGGHTPPVVVGPALPPLPPPIPAPYAVRAALPVAITPSIGATEPATRKESSSRTCNITGLPGVPSQGSAGGVFTLKFADATSRCIAGIESSDDWLHIKFFNGRELHLEIDPNPNGRSREASLIFASMTDSQMVNVSQSAAGSSGAVAKR